MNWETWQKLSAAEKAQQVDKSGLTQQLCGYEGARVEVVTSYGETRRFWVGKSTGWKPCHLEVATVRSMGGISAERDYKSVRVIRWK